MDRNLSVLEKELLLDFLKDLDDRYGNAGCNDYSLPNTPSQAIHFD